MVVLQLALPKKIAIERHRRKRALAKEEIDLFTVAHRRRAGHVVSLRSFPSRSLFGLPLNHPGLPVDGDGVELVFGCTGREEDAVADEDWRGASRPAQITRPSTFLLFSTDHDTGRLSASHVPFSSGPRHCIQSPPNVVPAASSMAAMSVDLSIICSYPSMAGILSGFPARMRVFNLVYFIARTDGAGHICPWFLE